MTVTVEGQHAFKGQIPQKHPSPDELIESDLGLSLRAHYRKANKSDCGDAIYSIFNDKDLSGLLVEKHVSTWAALMFRSHLLQDHGLRVLLVMCRQTFSTTDVFDV